MSNAGVATTSRSGSHDPVALSFAHALARELAEGRVQLPGFPKVAVQVQRVLADEDVPPLRVVRAVGAEPVLAGRIVQCANSIVFNPGAMPVHDLRTAVIRVGLDFVRTLTISFAVAQLRQAAELAVIRLQLDALWERSVTVSTLCFIIARRHTRINADAALLAGLLHGVGRLYILTRAASLPHLLVDVESYTAIEDSCHADLARALLESWRISAAIIAAVDALHAPATAAAASGDASLHDVLRAAVAIAATPPAELAQLASVAVCQRLGLTAAAFGSIVEESAAEVEALRAVLGPQKN